MASGINSFLSSFKGGLARPSRFDVTIPIPLPLATYITDARNLTYRCETAQLPGRTFETALKKMGSAPVEKFPYHTNYNESMFTFIISDDMNEKIFFDAWMELINPTTNFNFQYKANYAVDITVNQYNSSNELTYAGVLQEAFPIDVNQLDLDWSTDSYHKLAVVFCYKQWNNLKVSNVLQTLGQNLLTGVLNDVTSS
jgi:hypothetical protein